VRARRYRDRQRGFENDPPDARGQRDRLDDARVLPDLGGVRRHGV